MTMTPPRHGLVAGHESRPTTTSSPIGQRVRLRPVQPADRRTLMGFDRESAQRDFPRFDGYRHWAAHRASDPEPAPGNPAPDDDIQLAIESLRDRILVGSMCATIDEQNSGMFSYGVGIGPRHRRSGYAGDAINTLLAHMFGRLRYHKCEVGIYSCNAASLALHEKLGFRERGRLLDPQFLCGGAQSLVLMTITATEFAAFNPNSALAR